MTPKRKLVFEFLKKAFNSPYQSLIRKIKAFLSNGIHRLGEIRYIADYARVTEIKLFGCYPKLSSFRLFWLKNQASVLPARLYYLRFVEFPFTIIPVSKRQVRAVISISFKKVDRGGAWGGLAKVLLTCVSCVQK